MADADDGEVSRWRRRCAVKLWCNRGTSSAGRGDPGDSRVGIAWTPTLTLSGRRTNSAIGPGWKCPQNTATTAEVRRTITVVGA